MGFVGRRHREAAEARIRALGRHAAARATAGRSSPCSRAATWHRSRAVEAALAVVADGRARRLITSAAVSVGPGAGRLDARAGERWVYGVEGEPVEQAAELVRRSARGPACWWRATRRPPSASGSGSSRWATGPTASLADGGGSGAAIGPPDQDDPRDRHRRLDPDRRARRRPRLDRARRRPRARDARRELVRVRRRRGRHHRRRLPRVVRQPRRAPIRLRARADRSSRRARAAGSARASTRARSSTSTGGPGHRPQSSRPGSPRGRRPSEVLVSATTRELAAGSGLVFTDRGEHVLEGLSEPRRLYAAVAAHAPTPAPVAEPAAADELPGRPDRTRGRRAQARRRRPVRRGDRRDSSSSACARSTRTCARSTARSASARARPPAASLPRTACI